MVPGSIHTCAAKAFITDLEDAKPPGMNAQEPKDDIVYYGTTFGLTSRHTSFIAIDNNQPTPRPVGLSHDIFTMFGVSPAAKATAAPTARAYSAVSFIAGAPGAGPQAGAGKIDDDYEADPAVLFELSVLQSVNGGFGAKSPDVLRLLLPLGACSRWRGRCRPPCLGVDGSVLRRGGRRYEGEDGLLAPRERERR